MSDRTAIQWTDATWNPVTGCTEVSPGCDHCYAKTFTERWRGVPGHHFEHGFDVQLRPDKLTEPLRWRKPRLVFVNSMSDLFHDSVPDDYIVNVFGVMVAAHRHTFQVLTKRHARMRALLSRDDFRERAARAGAASTDDGDLVLDAILDAPWPPHNVWLGVSVENQRWADIRVPALLDTPAAVRFLSCEPLLEPVDLTGISTHMRGPVAYWEGRDQINALTGQPREPEWRRRAGVNWVIVGGESGPGARPMHPDWSRSLRDQCEAADVAFFFKQWGEWAPVGLGIGMAQHNVGREVLVGPRLDDMGHRQVMRRVGKGRAGRLLDGRTWDEMPEVGAS